MYVDCSNGVFWLSLKAFAALICELCALHYVIVPLGPDVSILLVRSASAGGLIVNLLVFILLFVCIISISHLLCNVIETIIL